MSEVTGANADNTEVNSTSAEKIIILRESYGDQVRIGVVIIRRDENDRQTMEIVTAPVDQVEGL